jgi:multicomponent K+:H+ antiporter subunit E
MLTRLIPHPLLSLTLVLVWLGLVNTLTLGNLILGTVFGLVIPMLTQAYWPDRPKIGRPLKIVEYILIVLWDIVVANVQVAHDHPVPARTQHPLALDPGAARPDLGRGDHRARGHHHHDARHGVGHALGGRRRHPRALPAHRRPDAVRDEIKARYERRLKEIFP